MKGDTVLAFIGGAIIGAAAAILFAPDSGDKTRKKIKDAFEREYQDLKSKVSDKTPETQAEYGEQTE